MGHYRSFKSFFQFNKEVVYLIAFVYIILIAVIIALSVVISQQNKTIILLQNGILRDQSRTYVEKPYINKLLRREYRAFTRVEHR